MGVRSGGFGGVVDHGSIEQLAGDCFGAGQDRREGSGAGELGKGVHFMQVSKWLGHSTFTLTLDTYGDYIPEQDGGAANNLPEPPASTRARRTDR